MIKQDMPLVFYDPGFNVWFVQCNLPVLTKDGEYISSEEGVKQPQHEADQSLSFGVEVKNAWSYAPTSPICLQGINV
jgi:hypothetical protein